MRFTATKPPYDCHAVCAFHTAGTRMCVHGMDLKLQAEARVHDLKIRTEYTIG